MVNLLYFKAAILEIVILQYFMRTFQEIAIWN